MSCDNKEKAMLDCSVFQLCWSPVAMGSVEVCQELAVAAAAVKNGAMSIHGIHWHPPDVLKKAELEGRATKDGSEAAVGVTTAMTCINPTLSVQVSMLAAECGGGDAVGASPTRARSNLAVGLRLHDSWLLPGLLLANPAIGKP